MKSSRISLILRSIQELGSPVRVSGTTPATAALLIVRLARESGGPLVVLCPNDDSAVELATDLETLAALVERSPLLVCHFPTWEQSPYSPIAHPCARAWRESRF